MKSDKRSVRGLVINYTCKTVQSQSVFMLAQKESKPHAYYERHPSRRYQRWCNMPPVDLGTCRPDDEKHRGLCDLLLEYASMPPVVAGGQTVHEAQVAGGIQGLWLVFQLGDRPKEKG